MEELKEKTWELDTNTRNNLVFYGIKEDGTTGNTEWAVREVVKDETESFKPSQILFSRLSAIICTYLEIFPSENASVIKKWILKESDQSLSSLKNMWYVSVFST